MKSSLTASILLILFVSIPSALAQDRKASNAPGFPELTATYPEDQIGIFIQGTSWAALQAEMPAKSRVKHSIAASISYSVVPASLVAEYEGLHAKVHVNPGRPVICICGAFSLPAAPLLVRLHPNPKKNMREFNGGHVPVIGTKVADANQNDLLAVEVSQPEESVWLVRPQQELPAGEYALMIGTRNVSIYPFTVSPVSREVATPTAAKF